MSIADPWERARFASPRCFQTRLGRHAFALLVVALATALSLCLRHFGFSSIPYLCFAPAVVVVAMRAGFWPGILVSVVSTAVGAYLMFAIPNFIGTGTAEDFLRPPLFLLTGVFLTALTCGRDRAKSALRVSDAELNRAQAVAQIGSWHYEIDGEALRLSQEAYRILGRMEKSISPQEAREIVHPDDREGVDRAWETALTSGVFDEQIRVLVGDRTRWVRVLGNIAHNANGHSVAVGTVQDITERRRVEEALRESEDRYRDLVEHSEDLVCTHDLEGRLVTVNPAPARILGYSVEDLLRIPMRELIVPEGRELFDQYLERLRITGNPEKGLLCVMTRNGEARTWEYYNTLRTEGVEKPVVRGMAHDITEQLKLERARSQAEDAMRRSEERFRVALKNSPIAMFSQDRDLRYTWVHNPSLFEPNEIVGKTDEELLGVEKAHGLTELKQKVLNEGVGKRDEIVIRHNGASAAFDITIEPLFDSERNIVGITGAAMDVARLRQLADNLQERADNLQEAKEKLAREKSYLEGEIQSELGFEEIVGTSPALREVLKKARVVAPTDSTVLLLGETGTGKELVARAVHALSARRDKSFIKLNCAAVPSGLLESELFGYEKGAFTSAVTQKVGRLELADGGTLFLDEVGELPLELQPKLLRVLQDREFERLGGVRTMRVDVRIISATNRDLQKDVLDREFREDLFYRLNVFPIQLPPLRNRRADIPMLVTHFVHKYAARMGRPIHSIPLDTMHVLQSWNWPGNVRELENVIERMMILSKDNVLAAPPVELRMRETFPEDSLTEMGREHIIRVLRQTNGALSGADGAASRLGIKRTTLQSMLKRYGIEPQEFRP